MIKILNPKPRFGNLSVIEHFQEYNRITILEFGDIIGKLGFTGVSSDRRIVGDSFKITPFITIFLT